MSHPYFTELLRKNEVPLSCAKIYNTHNRKSAGKQTLSNSAQYQFI
jgi:hypothetical protein